MQQIIAIALGGSVGAVSRYLINEWTFKRFPAFAPAGTLVANLLGCLLIGLLMAIFASKPDVSPAVKAFLITGCLGSLTTFSTFGYQSVELMMHGELRAAVLNVLANLVVGLVAVFVGWQGGMWIVR